MALDQKQAVGGQESTPPGRSRGFEKGLRRSRSALVDRLPVVVVLIGLFILWEIGAFIVCLCSPSRPW